MKIKNFINYFLDLFFPKRCLSCGKEETFLCSTCFAKIVMKIEQVCPVCEKVSVQGETHASSCASHTNLKGLLVTCTYHNNPVLEKVIKQFKYHYSQELSEYLGTLLVRAMRANMMAQRILDKPELQLQEWILVPVPLHSKRKKWRGFDQAEALARAVGESLQIPVVELLQRVKNTKQQAKLDRAGRLKNLQEAFTFNPHPLLASPLQGEENFKKRRILLIDDVATTLATLNAAAQALKTAGFQNIWGVVIARG